MKKNRLLLDALEGKEVTRAPVWLMRQAGRYMPRYQDMRKKHSLGCLFRQPDLAAEVTLLPLKEFPLDAAIVFSDLLVLLEVFGKQVLYPEGGGLSISPTVKGDDLLKLATKEEVEEKLSYVFKTLQIVKPALSVPLLGFAGAPFTLLSYLVEGKGGSYEKVKTFIKERKTETLALLDTIAEVVISYIELQIEAGADAVQVFDSWTHVLSEEEFSLYALPYWKKIQKRIQRAPLIFFSRTNSRYVEEISALSPAAISFEEGTSLSVLRKKVPGHIAVQGNYCPRALLEKSAEEVNKEAKEMRIALQGQKGVIFNLGHGVLPKTPVENVHAFLEGVRTGV